VGSELLGREYSGRDAWGGVEMVVEGLVRAVRGGSATVSAAAFGAAQE
jgi:hypothetical protein